MTEPSFWEVLGMALALVLVIEGMLPFLNPANFRESLLHVCRMSNQQLRTIGFVSMMLGLLLLYWVH